MSLTRYWTPTGSYSGGGKKRLLVVHTMEGFTGSNGAKDCAVYFQGDVGASSHVCIDNNRGKLWEGVARSNSAWTQCNFNSVSVSCEQSGYASWSRQYWLDNRSNQLHNIADWIREESGKLGIPIKRLNASQAQGGSAGICGHQDLGSTGCGHADPGANWPWDKVLEWAGGSGGGTPPPSGGGSAPPLHVDYFGQSHNSQCGDVRTWQDKMRSRGWSIDVDQIYGPASESVCRQFQSEKGLGVDGLVGPATWSATWTAPVT
jgi:peptidoglycan hydrolase-like protein with peptidoglycan-binding domain